MALIKCPCCGKEMSDRATHCPQCGMPNGLLNESVICPECGIEISDATVECPNCGCPISRKDNLSNNSTDAKPAPSIKSEMSKNKKKWIWLAIIL